MTKTERRNITQPADHWAAFEAEATRRGLSLSEFMGLAAARLLAKEKRCGLSERVKPGRKKNEKPRKKTKQESKA